jgi:hypothetical protein
MALAKLVVTEARFYVAVDQFNRQPTLEIGLRNDLGGSSDERNVQPPGAHPHAQAGGLA